MGSFRFVTGATLVCSVAIAACGDPATPTRSPLNAEALGARQPGGTLSRIVVTPATASIVVRGTVTLAATGYDVSGRQVSLRKPSWSSSAASVATVSSSGVVTGIAPGSATIAVTASGITGTATVSVTQAPVASVTVTPSSATLAVGGTQGLTATLRDANGNVLTGRPITWASSDAGIATVASSGLVTAVGNGTATVTATSEGVSGSSAIAVTTATSSGRWVSGYWVGYQRSLYPETTIDFSILTHIIVGAIQATPNGGVTTDFFLDNVTGPAVARTISTRAHQAGRKAILMLGGAGYDANLRSATTSTNRATFVSNLVATMDQLGYDGIDVDWEPILESDKPQLLALLQALRAARPGMVLTMPVGWVNANFGADAWVTQVTPIVDQLNFMSYQMADNWGGWVSWHHAALYGEGGNHPSSVASTARAYLAVGVPAAKLGIGIGFYGSCWRGANTMLQTLGSGAGVYASDNSMSYANIMASYFTSSAYRWDATAQSGYLSFATQTGPQGCTMVSYEDEQSIAAKGAYVKSAGLGGAIIWNINQGHMPASWPAGVDPLLTAAYRSIVQ